MWFVKYLTNAAFSIFFITVKALHTYTRNNIAVYTEVLQRDASQLCCTVNRFKSEHDNVIRDKWTRQRDSNLTLAGIAS